MRKLVTLTLLCLILSYLQPASTSALSCAELLSVEKAYEEYDGVVVGQVDKVIRKGEHNEVRLTVVRSFKGVESRTLSVQENMTWGNLNGPSEVGASYLFFLQVMGDTWENPLCSPSMKIEQASEALEYLSDKEIPLTVGLSDSSASAEDNAAVYWIILAAIAVLLVIAIYGLLRMRAKRS